MVEEHERTVLLSQKFLGDASFTVTRQPLGFPYGVSRDSYGISNISAASLRVIFGSNPPL